MLIRCRHYAIAAMDYDSCALFILIAGLAEASPNRAADSAAGSASPGPVLTGQPVASWP